MSTKEPTPSPEEAAAAEALRVELTNMTGTQRAAVLTLLLGEQQAAEIIKFMDPKEVQHLGGAMVSVADVSQEAVNAILDDFVATFKKQSNLGLGTTDYVEKVGHLHHQQEIGARGYAPTLLNCGLLNGAIFKRLQQLFTLFVQADFNQCRDPLTHELAQFVRRQDGHLLLNPAFLHQTLGSAQAGGGRNLQFVGQCNVADAGIGLQSAQQFQICGV